MKSKKTIIGLIEKVNFPILGFKEVEAKMDTGAYTSSMHCEEIEVQNDKALFVKIKIGNRIKEFLFKNFKKIVVKSSNGQSEERFLIKTYVKIGKSKIKTEFTLRNREDMKYSILLGRRFLNGNFLIDPEKRKTVDKKTKLKNQD